MGIHSLIDAFYRAREAGFYETADALRCEILSHSNRSSLPQNVLEELVHPVIANCHRELA